MTQLTGPDVFARTVPLIVERHYFGEMRSASLANVEVHKASPEEADADKRYLDLKKKLLTAPEVRAIRQRDSDFREYLKSVATPFRPGFWLVPVGLAATVYEKAQEWERERAELVEAAARVYPARVAEMRQKLGPLYNPLDYPPVATFKAAYSVEVRFVDFGVPNLLREISAEVFAEEQAKVRAQAEKARELIEQHAAATLLEITDHLTWLLQPKAGGKYPALREGSLDRLTAFLDTAAMRDVTDFEGLRRVTARLQRLTGGVTLDALRDDEALRAQLAKGMAAAKDAVAKLVTDETRRGIRLREEVA